MSPRPPTSPALPASVRRAVFSLAGDLHFRRNRKDISMHFQKVAVKIICSISILGLFPPSPVLGWGVRGHHEINSAAVRALPPGELDFLKAQESWIIYLSIIPDTY